MQKFIFTSILIATLLSVGRHRTPLLEAKTPVFLKAEQPQSIGQQIQLTRIRNGFSQKYLARLSGITVEEIMKIESGTTIPTVNALYKIQEILGEGIIINGDQLVRL